MKKTGDYWITYVEVEERELDPVEVWYDVSPAEPDVNWGGGLDIECVMYKGNDVLDKLSSEELDNLIDRTSEYLNTYHGEDPRY